MNQERHIGIGANYTGVKYTGVSPHAPGYVLSILWNKGACPLVAENLVNKAACPLVNRLDSTPNWDMGACPRVNRSFDINLFPISINNWMSN